MNNTAKTNTPKSATFLVDADTLELRPVAAKVWDAETRTMDVVLADGETVRTSDGYEDRFETKGLGCTGNLRHCEALATREAAVRSLTPAERDARDAFYTSEKAAYDALGALKGD